MIQRKRCLGLLWENEDTDNGFLSMVLIPADSKEDADVIYQHMKGNFTPH